MIKLRQQTAEQSHEVTSEVTATTVSSSAAAAEKIRAERDAALNEVVTLQQSMSALKEVCAI